MNKDDEVDGIHAGKIDADNVVKGVQIQGGDPKAATELISLAQAIRSGSITADEIKAKNLVSGLQYISDPTTANVDDLRKEISTLRAQLEDAISGGEFANASDAEDAKEALIKAESELAAPKPQGGRVVRKLAELSEIFTRSAEIAQSAGKIGAKIIKLAPVAATLWQIAQRLLGG